MTMTRDQKCETLRHKTTEVDVRYLVADEHAQAFEQALHKLAESLPGVIVSRGGYADSPEWDEIEEIVDNVPDEKLETL